MKKALLSIVLFATIGFTKVYAQNKGFLATTSIGLFRPAKQINGINTSGFTTVTGVELQLKKQLWLTASADFQSISYKQESQSLDIDGKLGMIPVLLGGRFLFSNASKFTPYISLNAGLTILDIPKFETKNSKLRVFSETRLPFTFALRGGVQFQLNQSFFPYIELGFQSLKDDYFTQKLNFVSVNIGMRTYPF